MLNPAEAIEKNLVEKPSSVSKGTRCLSATERNVLHTVKKFSSQRRDAVGRLFNAALLLLTIGLVGGGLYLKSRDGQEIEINRRLNVEQNQRLTRLEQQAARMERQIAGLAASNYTFAQRLSLPHQLSKTYRNGICLISGTFIFIDPATGRPLRTSELRTEYKPGKTVQNFIEGEENRKRPESEGEIAKVTYIGTGFHVGGGYLLTNKHIAFQPWNYDIWSKIIGNLIHGQPKMTQLIAFFPGRPRSYALRFRSASLHDDLAVCQLDELPTDLPVLPLDQADDSNLIGQAISVMGYPDGDDRLLASLPLDQAENLLERYGESEPALLRWLARRNLVSPLITQGHITDLRSDRIVYDAVTGEGASGSPLFGESGRVIGIHYGYYQRNRGSNYAVPISRSFALLRKAGWKTLGVPLPLKPE